MDAEIERLLHGGELEPGGDAAADAVEALQRMEPEPVVRDPEPVVRELDELDELDDVEALRALVRKERQKNRALKMASKILGTRGWRWKTRCFQARGRLKRERAEQVRLRRAQGKKGKASRYFSVEGGVFVALKRNVGNASASAIGRILSLDTHHTSVVRWEIRTHAALVAARRNGYKYLEGRMRARCQDNFVCSFHVVKSDTTNKQIIKNSSYMSALSLHLIVNILRTGSTSTFGHVTALQMFRSSATRVGELPTA